MLYTDQTGRRVNIPSPPQRIVSLVPSQTELLYDLGADVAGITKFCIHPEEWFRTKTRVGGTKQVKFDVIASLQPDLIIANKEENEKEQVESLAKDYPVWVSDIHTLDDALDMIVSLGDILARHHAAQQLAQNIRGRFDLLQPLKTAVPTAYFIWRDPWMVAGGDTFIHQMLRACGLRNVFEDIPRYPSVSLPQLAASACKLVLLSSEPYPFKEKHIGEIREYLPDADILLVDGEMFSWYGSRLLHAPGYFNDLLDPLR
ncbi:helical backbone metal receptor [Chitinophaga sp. GCM10012297]|uniref:ABC transporter substrate-binding protein n=1 Tax=Chitinophaga chungangae TaxID=2821488 RepID=A0ABS3YHS3_9BACT|nr:helical backbone metal receptor [Chitinophaga chungangae]MBO9154189.1 ABC transporter substrate-binding protein [Chitinophaga chungangae]